METFGAKVIAQYALLGPYDFLTLLEAPNPETVARLSVELGRRGLAQYETFPAIPVETFMATLKAPRHAEVATPRLRRPAEVAMLKTTWAGVARSVARDIPSFHHE